MHQAVDRLLAYLLHIVHQDRNVTCLYFFGKRSTNPRESRLGFPQYFWYAQVPWQQGLNRFDRLCRRQITQYPT